MGTSEKSFPNLFDILQPGNPSLSGVFPRPVDDSLESRLIQESIFQIVVLIGEAGKNANAVARDDDILFARLLQVGGDGF
uniref:Uncharacterized protein n=2 Tax=Candidatus Kentrum sp. FM TaxID=2126340 RepID=A0A450TE36_9GAMM|nr:MAG: hypothetical protein BECKFM1743C_GA0114222_103903 [Candidatus Kentron sp. FM]